MSCCQCYTTFLFFSFFFNDTATTEIYTLSLHDALPIFGNQVDPPGTEESGRLHRLCANRVKIRDGRSEEHTSELQSHSDLVCRLLLEKKNTYKQIKNYIINTMLMYNYRLTQYIYQL